MIGLYSWLKSSWSRLNDLIKKGEPRSPVPLFPSPEFLGEWMVRHVPYTGDPAIPFVPGTQGAGDHYVHPERIQAAIERGEAKRLHIDCDDFACYAFEALRAMGARPLLFTLRDDSDKFGHHVICGYATPAGFGAIDTNGHRKLPNLTPATLCAEWSHIYAAQGYRYGDAVPTPYPF